MCNRYRNSLPPDVYAETFSQLRVPFRWADGRASNLEPREAIGIRDTAPIVRRASDPEAGEDAGVELAVAPWAWAGPGGKPVFNFRSDGRSFGGSDRVLIPADGFYEFTPAAEPGARRKDRWLFTVAGEPWFWIAGVMRQGAWAMLTTEPGPDIRPYHDRQVVVLRRDQALDWLDLRRPERELLRPAPAGMLEVRAA